MPLAVPSKSPRYIGIKYDVQQLIKPFSLSYPPIVFAPRYFCSIKSQVVRAHSVEDAVFCAAEAAEVRLSLIVVNTCLR